VAPFRDSGRSHSGGDMSGLVSGWLRRWHRRLRTLFAPNRAWREMDEEMRYHVDREVEELVRGGMEPADARRRALMQFGSIERFKDEGREARGGSLLEDLGRDLAFGFRGLGKRPVFAVAAILTLSLGIGMTTTMFTVVNGVLLRPLSGTNTKGVVYIERESEDGRMSAGPTVQLLRLLRDHTSSFSQIEAYRTEAFTFTVDGEPLRVEGATASVEFFSFLGVRPMLGRGFLPQDGRGTDNPVVILSHAFWTRRFGQDRGVLGRTVRIDDRIHEIVGVLPADFRVDSPDDILFWIPEGAAGELPAEGARVSAALARLTAGVSLESARAELTTLLQNNPLDQEAHLGWIGKIQTPGDLVGSDLERAILILQAAALLVLLIGCANLANLLQAQGEARAREFALRTSLGATRARLVRQLLAENLLLGAFGGLGGVFLTHWTLRAVPTFLPSAASVALNGTVLLFATAVSLMSVFVVGIIPALKGSRRRLLSETIRGTSSVPRGPFKHLPARQLLLATEVATTVVLLVSAGLLLKSFSGLRAMDTGFNDRGLVTLSLELPEQRYGTGETQVDFFDQLSDGLRGYPPELGSATLASGFITDLAAAFGPLVREGAEEAEAKPQLIVVHGVAPGFFQVAGIPIHQGQDFRDEDGRGGEKVAIINEAVARRYFRDVDPVGRRIRLNQDWYRVVGVAGAVRLPNLVRNGVGELELYFPYVQDAGPELTIVARVSGDQSAAIGRLKQIVWSVDRSIPLVKVASVDDLLAESLGQERSNALLMGLFALAALLLGAVGIYGVVAYSVSRSTREVGIRMALGARKGNVVIGVVMRGMRTVLAGMLLGSVAAVALASTLSRLLYDVPPRDPAVFVIVTAGVAAVSFVAAWLPARRAAGADPLDSLKTD
jgi:predicted permease